VSRAPEISARPEFADTISPEPDHTAKSQIQNRKVETMGNIDGEKLTVQAVSDIIKGYILAEFLPGEDPSQLTDATPLITGGILDSLGTIKLVAFLEQRFKIQIQAHETMVDYLDTLADITQLVMSKL
jgi:acyl carrier protein